MEKYLSEITGLKISLPMAVLLTGASLFALMIVAQSLFAAFFPGQTTQIQQVGKRGVLRDQILLVGPAGSGKTTLFFKLTARQEYKTVSSCEINQSREGILIPKSILGSEVDSLKQIPLTDVPGHYNFKAKLREQFLPGARAIVLVIDSKDKDRLAEAADILYDVVSDIDLATTGVPVLVVCNKQDLQFSKRATQIERDLQIEIEQIRKVKRAAREQEQDNSIGQSHTANAGAKTGSSTPLGYLESLKGKFQFDQLRSPPQFVECSVQANQLEEIYKFVSRL